MRVWGGGDTRPACQRMPPPRSGMSQYLAVRTPLKTRSAASMTWGAKTESATGLLSVGTASSISPARRVTRDR